MRIRARLVQDGSVKGTETAAIAFQEMVQTGSRFQASAGYYGQVLIALKQNDAAKAEALLPKVKKLLGEKLSKSSLALASTSIDIKIAARQPGEAAREALVALARFPTSRALSRQYAAALYHAGNYTKAAE